MAVKSGYLPQSEGFDFARAWIGNENDPTELALRGEKPDKKEPQEEEESTKASEKE